jgi:glycosyltransferase involved in cell wall biosynthesis
LNSHFVENNPRALLSYRNKMKVGKHIALISVHGDPAIDIGKEEAGGQNVYVLKVGKALAKLGWNVDMFTRKTNPNQPEIVQHDARCRTIRLVAGPEAFVPRDNLFEYLPLFVDRFKEFQTENNLKYELVHTNYWLSGWVGMKLAKDLSLKQVHTYHSLGAVKYQSVSEVPFIAGTRLQVEKACLESAACVVATSPQEKEHMRQLVSDKGNIDIIPCGTDIESFGSVSRSEARLRLGIPRSSLVVLYVGRFDRRKGIETLVRAIGRSIFPGLADIRLILAGGSRPGQSDGIERERIEGIVDELGLRDFTTFPGQIDRETLPYYFGAANVCVVPSHYEPFGLVAIEAMAAGVPVVASDVGGLKYTVVPEKTGLLCPPQDDAAFAEAIDRILSRPTWERKLGKAARERVKTKFGWDEVGRQLTELYNDLITESSRELVSVGSRTA